MTTSRTGNSIRSVRNRCGFTLIELLLVVTVVLLATFVATPTFLRSMRWARLRSSVRTVVMMHRHARSYAVLQQRHAALLFDRETGTIELVAIRSPESLNDRVRFLEELPSEAEGKKPEVEPILRRALAEGVKVSRFSSERRGQEYDQIAWVNYHPNGMCDGFSLQLADERGRGARIQVAPYSGVIEVEEL